MRLLCGARAPIVCRRRTESWCVLASCPPVSRRSAARPGCSTCACSRQCDGL